LHAFIYVLLSVGMPSLCTLAYRIYAIRRTPKSRVTETIAALNRPRVSIRIGRFGGVDIEQDTLVAVEQPRPVRRRKSA
jgi:hypothetical protein